MQRTILFIDDDVLMRRIIARQFERGSPAYRVVSADTGREGIRKAGKILPDLIILDIVLRRENGWDIAEELRGAESTGKIPILIFSGEGSFFDEDLYVENELIDGYVRKLCSFLELLAAVNGMLESIEK